MHFLAGLAILATAIGYVFGETAARAFVGVLLGFGALVVMMAVSIGLVGFGRQGW